MKQKVEHINLRKMTKQMQINSEIILINKEKKKKNAKTENHTYQNLK